MFGGTNLLKERGYAIGVCCGGLNFNGLSDKHPHRSNSIWGYDLYYLSIANITPCHSDKKR
jgi:hypothetical protein